MVEQDISAFRGHTALIADDDEFFRIALASILTKRFGFHKVIETSTFDTAIDRLRPTDNVKLALFDLNMPGMNNWANLRSIRDFFPSVRVSVVSGSQDREDILMALNIGLHGFIHKGLGVAELGRAIGLILEGNVYVPAFLPDLAICPREKPLIETTEAAHHSPAVNLLTPRQNEVLKLLILGKSNKGMARDLKLSEGTVKFHLAAIFRFLGVSNRVEAATSGAALLRSATG
ncbi:MAG: response regulator transcription factor [Loktanella sp.]|nr:response regulator transcription factor [Loktanella sp.]